jgi:formate dehydrogenase subunit delta
VTNADKLIRMANQIAANLMQSPDPVAATAEHIVLFWDSRMKEQIIANQTHGLSITAAAAIKSLAQAQ